MAIEEFPYFKIDKGRGSCRPSKGGVLMRNISIFRNMVIGKFSYQHLIFSIFIGQMLGKWLPNTQLFLKKVEILMVLVWKFRFFFSLIRLIILQVIYLTVKELLNKYIVYKLFKNVFHKNQSKLLS